MASLDRIKHRKDNNRAIYKLKSRVNRAFKSSIELTSELTNNSLSVNLSLNISNKFCISPKLTVAQAFNLEIDYIVVTG
jgi:hypothetical protein